MHGGVGGRDPGPAGAVHPRLSPCTGQDVCTVATGCARSARPGSVHLDPGTARQITDGRAMIIAMYETISRIVIDRSSPTPPKRTVGISLRSRFTGGSVTT